MAAFSSEVEKKVDALRAKQRKEAWKERDRKRRESGAQVMIVAFCTPPQSMLLVLSLLSWRLLQDENELEEEEADEIGKPSVRTYHQRIADNHR